MNYHIAICDDSNADTGYLSSLVIDWSNLSKNIINIETFLSAEAFLFHYTEDKTYHILLLDIEMGNMNGVQLAREIRKNNETVQIIFITGYSDYIAEGYEVSALHYLIKPVNKGKLFHTLDRAASKIKYNEKSIQIKTTGETAWLPLYEIRYLEVRQNYTTIHARLEYTVKRTLGDIEKELDERFFRIGRSYIVNLSYIRRVTKTEIYLGDDATIPLPRSMYEPLNRAIISRI